MADTPPPASPLDTPPPAARSEQISQLLELTGRGSHPAFAELYRMTAPKVLAITTALIRDRAQAEEVSQEVFLEVWCRAHKFDRSKGPGLAWLSTLARSRAVDRIRHAQAAKSHEHTYTRNSFHPDFDHVSDHVINADTAQQLHAAVAALAPLYQEAVIHTYLTGHTYLQASHNLNIPLSTLKSRMREALSALRASPLLA